MNAQLFGTGRLGCAGCWFTFLILILGGCSKRTSDNAEFPNSAADQAASEDSWDVPESFQPVAVDFEYQSDSAVGTAGSFTDLDPTGTGTFEPFGANRSGVVVTGDATSLTTVEFNRDESPDFLVGRNNSHPITFQNQTPDTVNIAVRLDSVHEGRDMLNAKVWADDSDGSRQLNELRSSDGYLSQSAPIIFIGNRNH